MYVGKNFVGAAATSTVWFIVAVILLDFRLGVGITYFEVLTVSIGIILSYFVLRRVDKTYARQPQTRVDRFLTSLDDGELDALRDRLSGGMMGDGEYGSLDDLMMENEVKAKRR